MKSSFRCRFWCCCRCCQCVVSVLSVLFSVFGVFGVAGARCSVFQRPGGPACRVPVFRNAAACCGGVVPACAGLDAGGCSFVRCGWCLPRRLRAVAVPYSCRIRVVFARSPLFAAVRRFVDGRWGDGGGTARSVCTGGDLDPASNRSSRMGREFLYARSLVDRHRSVVSRAYPAAVALRARQRAEGVGGAGAYGGCPEPSSLPVAVLWGLAGG